MIKQIIAYVLVIFGLPVLIGSFIWFIPSLLLAKTVGQSHARIESSISAFVEGAISSTAGYLIFSWLGAGPMWVIPIFVIIVVVTWNNARNEGYLNVPGVVGVLSSFVGIFYLK